MNNIQKSFKQKSSLSLRKAFAFGGYVDPNSSDYDAINAEKTQRWEAENAAQRGATWP